MRSQRIAMLLSQFVGRGALQAEQSCSSCDFLFSIKVFAALFHSVARCMHNTRER